MKIRSALSALACALAFGGMAVIDVARPGAAHAAPAPVHSYDDPEDDDWDEPEPPVDDNGDGPLSRYICRLGIGHWTHPLADAITVYVWAHDFNEADQKARDDHPTTPPFEYIAWSRCDPA
ncbi:hypothetical protein [Segniliparus rugosus]|uniref:Secreted protein n=1 Tax=Segniliparus rugosus (strain ATCC BAA-974 / DSM 45345 / CCUG 50838 / CIP 108380 / JCM 13579 / CDC 945) TaxID=679197 RepID=E5XM08_SEGRC|nr:hypothetical protein [Segniliparus rugosus]EFV14614.2 hypothetical protein HMPREF9336_00527 [Segniliparus rugosus ATCC BAA-974]